MSSIQVRNHTRPPPETPRSYATSRRFLARSTSQVTYRFIQSFAASALTPHGGIDR
jgi:hypothetical protein